MKSLILVLLYSLSSLASADVLFKNSKDLFECMESRNASWIFRFGVDGMDHPVAAVYSQITFNPNKVEIFSFTNAAVLSSDDGEEQALLAYSDGLNMTAHFTRMAQAETSVFEWNVTLQFTGRNKPYETKMFASCRRL